MTNGESISPLRKLNLVMRFSYTLPFFMASLCGVLFTLSYDPELWLLIMIPLDVLFLAMFVNFSNDYFDHISGVDKNRFDDAERCRSTNENKLNEVIYWEGNQFDNGLVTIKQGKIIMGFLICMSIILSIPIVLHGGLLVIGLGLLAFFLAYFYTAPPIAMGGRGLGEINVGISFFMMVFFAFYVTTGVFNLEIFVFSLAIGLGVGLMRIVDSMTGYETHLKHEERDLAVRMGGLEETIPVVKSLQILFYILVASMMLFDLTYVLLLFTLPLAKKAWTVMKDLEDLWNIHLAPLFFGIAIITEFMFVITLIVQTFVSFPIL